MKAIISTTYSDTYLYFLPITTFLWNKLGVEVICFVPDIAHSEQYKKPSLIIDTMGAQGLKYKIHTFIAPEHKKTTYAQCLRNYAACLDLPLDEMLVTSDVDMAVFKIPINRPDGQFSIFGYDLVPAGQYPQCYVTASVIAWRNAFDLHDKTYQQAIDELLEKDECEHYRGNRWSTDQEQSYKHIQPTEPYVFARTNGLNQFSLNRLDRDDAYILERDITDIVDYHMHRPGYEHIETILTIFSKIYPEENFDWIRTFTEEYKLLL